LRSPQGVYAHVNLEQAIDEYLTAHHLQVMSSCLLPPGVSLSDLHNYLETALYRTLLDNSAVAGIKLGVHWCLIFQPYHTYDWRYLDDVFAAISLYAPNKTVQLSITPGFDSGDLPPWVACDGLFRPPPTLTAPSCDYITFNTFPEQGNADFYTLPLPWSSTYTTDWGRFLQALRDRINGQPDYKNALVAIVVAGPVGASTEMILPSSANSTIWVTNITTSGYYEDVDTAWKIVIDKSFPPPSTYASYPGQVFIDFWTTTITRFESLFSGITLILTPDSGAPSDMPNLAIADNPAQLASDCQGNASVSCAIKRQVLINFIGAPGKNGKATDIGGLTASSSTCLGNIGLPGVKLLTSMSQSPPFRGGAEFDWAASTCDADIRVTLGCPRGEKCTIATLTPEETAYNVLANFFSSTSVASDWPENGTSQTCKAGSPPDPSPIHYINFDYHDILYAKQADNYPCPQQCSPVPPGWKSMQDLLTDASQDVSLAAKRKPPKPLPPSSCSETRACKVTLPPPACSG
jgi:hypothetical protein